jgi:LPXTG-site transpeptidase (sortase) family protein
MHKVFKPWLVIIFITSLFIVSPFLQAKADVKAQTIYNASLSQIFNPATIGRMEKTRLSITVTNPNGFILNNVSWSDNLISVQNGLSIANPPNVLGNCGGGIVTANAGETTISLSDGSVAASGGTCTVSVDVVASVSGNLTNTIPADNLRATENGGLGTITNSSDSSAILNVATFDFPAEINKQFDPISIAPGDVSRLSVSIFNSNTFALNDAAWTDNLISIQPGLRIANPPNILTTCDDPLANPPTAVTALTGGTTISLERGKVPAQLDSNPGSCIVSVDVTSTTPGNLINTIPAGALSSTGIGGTVTVGNTSPSSATLQVDTVVPPSITKSFNPNTVWVGQTSQLTIDIKNNDLTHTLTEVTLADILNDPAPNNVVLANPVSASLSGCGGTAAALLTANSGSSSLSLNNAVIAANSTCRILLNVVSSVAGSYTNTIAIGAISSKQGVTNSSPASAPLNVQASSIQKAFFPTTIQAGEISLLTITLRNPTATAYTGVALDDVMPGTVLELVPGTAATDCGTGIAGVVTTGRANDTIRLTGGTIPAGSVAAPNSCTITVSVTTPDTALTQTHTNTIPANALVTDQGISNLLPVSTNLGVQRLSIGVVKGFSPIAIQQGGTSKVTITFQNRTSNPLHILSFTDDLPAGLVPITPDTAATTCSGGTASSTISPSAVTLTGGGIIPAGTVAVPGTCNVTVNVTTTGSVFPATYTNVIDPNTITTTEGATNLDTATRSIDVYPTDLGMTASKSFNPASILAGSNSRLRILLTAPADEDLTTFSVTDILPANVIISNSTAASLSGCGAGTLTAVSTGTGTITLSNASITKATTCQIDVYVTGAVSNVYTNTIAATQVTNDQGQRPAADISASLTVSHMTINKAFYPNTVSPGGLSTLTITLANTNTVPITGVALTDNLNTMVGTDVVIAPTPNRITTCGSGTVAGNAGTQIITLSNGSIPAQVGGVPGICTVSVDVMASSSIVTLPTTRTNTVSRMNVSGTIFGLGTVINPVADATANLTITPLSIGVVKGFNPLTVFGGSSSTLSVQLVNPNNTVLTGITFTDTMPLGMFVANPPNPSTGTCGGTLTASPGTQTFTFSGGILNASKRCTLTLSTTMNVNGNRTNTIAAGAVTTFNGAANPQAAQASLTNLPGASITKFFTPNSIIAGATSLLTIRITNTGNIALSNLGFTDTIPAALQILASPIPTSACGAGLTADAGTQLIRLAGGAIPAGPGTTCDIVVAVTGTTAGTYTNTIPKNSISSAEGATNTEPAVDTITVNSNPLLQLVKTLDINNSSPAPYLIGDTLSYQIVAKNIGDVPLTNVTITDPSVVMGTCTPVTLLPTQTLTCTATHLVVSDDTGSFINTATGDSDQTTPVTDSVTVPINKTDAISIKKVITSTAPYQLGNTLNYSITVTNLGTSTLNGVTVTDPGTNVTLGTCTPGQPSVLTPGTSMICAASHVVEQADVDLGSFTNTATADSVETAPVTDTVVVAIKKNPELKVFKQVTSNGPYNTVGAVINYDISTVNTGDETLHNVTLVDADPGVTMAPCTAATLVPGAILSCSASHTVIAADLTNGGYTNTATGDSDETLPASDTVTVITKTPSILLDKIGTLNAGANGRADAGDTISYAFTITNNGEVTLTNVKLTDIIGGITLSGASIPSLAPGASDTTNFTGSYVLKQSDIDSGTFSNTATATGYPPIGSPISSTDTDTKSGLSVPSLNLVKTITSGGNYNQAGAVIFYSYTLTNTGNVDLTGNGVGSLFTITDDYLGEFTCGAVTSLAIGSSITCTNNYTVTQADLDTGNSIINTANGHGKFGAQDVTSNDATATATESLTWNATLAKTLETTEVNGAGNDHTQAVIGETLTYKLVATFPPGSTLSSKIVDTLDAGLALVAIDSITVSNPDTDGAPVLTDSGLNSSKMTFAAGGACTNCVEGITVGTNNPLVETSGGKVTFDFGNVTNTSISNETITIVYRVMVLNITTNQSITTPLNNTAVFSWTGGSDTRSANPVAIVEPNVNVIKTVDIVNGVDAGNLLTYTVTLTNPAILPAFDVTLTDAFPFNATTLASQLETITITNVTDTDLTLMTAANFTITCDDAPGCVAPNRWTLNTVTPFDMPQDRTIVLTITANVSPTTLPNATIDNYAQVRWTSMDGDFSNRSTFVTDTSDSERTGVDGPGGLLNDYARQSPAVARTTLTNLAGTKYYVDSSEEGTLDTDSPPHVTIGEVVRYRLALRLNEGTMPDLSILDRLPPGMRFINDAQAKVAFVSDGGGITSSTINNLLPNCAGLNVTGTVADNTITGLLSSSITCSLPDTAVSGGTNSRTSNVDSYSSGTDVYFKFGDILNSDDDASNEFIVVEFNAVVENVSTNQGQNNLSSGSSTATLVNDFQANTNTATTPILLFTSTPTVDVQVAEPSITDLAKGINIATGDAGDQVTYTVTFSNSSSANSSPAYDVVLTDSVPAKMTLAAITPATDITFTPALCGAFGSDTTAGNTLTLNFISLAPGCAVSTTYKATLQVSVTPGEVLANSAVVNYSSLPGTGGTTSNPTGSNTPGAAGTATGERDGTGGQGADATILNNYRDLASTNFTVNNVTTQKTVVSTSEAHTSGSNVTIGEIIRYRLVMQLPETTITGLTLSDTFGGTGSGQRFLNDGTARVLFYGTTAGTITSADFTGPAPATIAPGLVSCNNSANATSIILADIADPIKFASTNVNCSLADANISSVETNNTDTYGTNAAVYFRLGTVTNNDNDADAEYVVIEFNTLVTNEANNIISRTLTDTFQGRRYNGTNMVNLGTASSSPAFTIIEPNIPVNGSTKTALPTTGDAGDQIEYTVTYTAASAATNSDAYDVRLLDNLSALPVNNFSFVPGTDITFGGSCLTPGTPLNNSTAAQLDLVIPHVAMGCQVTVKYRVNLTSAVNPSQTVTNTVALTYSSLPLDGTRNINPTGSETAVGSSGTATGERNGSGGVNTYAGSDTAGVTVNSVSLQKSLMSTSEAGTTGTSVAIGEIIRYRLVEQLIEGTQTNLQLQDALPAGLIFVNDSTARVSFVSDGGAGKGITSTTITSALAGCTNLNVPGADASLVTSASVACPLPDTAVSSLQASNNDTYVPDTNVWFNLGNISNADSDINNEYIIVEFNALMANTTATNQAFTNSTGVLSATTRTNNATLHLNGSGTATATSGNVNVTVAEPVIYNVNKTANITVGDAGDVINYTVTFTNTSAGSNANLSTAYDVRLLDTLPVYVGSAASINVASVGNCASGINTANSSGNTVDVRMDAVPVACAVTVTYSATILDTAPVGVTITNTAAVTYSSVPGSGTLKTDTANNPTGSDTSSFGVTDGASGGMYGERDGVSGGNNDYNDSEGHTVTISSLPVISKNAPTPTQYAIGSLVDYPIVVTVPEGTTRTVQVIDQVPAGMQYVSYSLNTASFTGTAAVSSVSPVTPLDGDDITFNFGDVVATGNNTADNSFTVTIRLRVLNIAGNQNQTILTNSALLRYIPSNGSATSDISGGSQNITVIEPILNLAKSADDASWVYGQAVQYTLDLTHASGSGTASLNSAANAYDLVIADTIPTGLTYVSTVTPLPTGWTVSYTAPVLTLSCLTTAPCSLPLGSSAQFKFNVTVNAPPSANVLDGNSPNAVNSARVTWTSLSGDNNPGASTGERDGSNGPAGSPNDHAKDATHSGDLVDYYSIGNRVWFDTDNSSDMNGSETGIGGVTVNLYEDTGNLAGTPTGTFVDSGRSVVTTASGYYIFDYLIPGDYQVVLPASNFAGALKGYWSSGTFIDGVGVVSTTPAAIVNLNAADADDNGSLVLGSIVSSTVTLGPTGLTEPTGEVATQLQSGVLGSQGAQPDGRANMTVDFGFYKTEIGNLVFSDNDTSGHYNTGDTPLVNWNVRLFAANGSEILVGTDGILNTADDLSGGTVQTDASGLYKFSGLPKGDYIIKVTTPANVVSTIDTFDGTDTADPDTTTDNNDNGIGEGGVSVPSGIITMTPGQVKTNIDITTVPGVTTNPTVDFGFVPLYSLGNRVWFDTNNNSVINALEIGVDGVIVDLYRADISGNPTGAIIATDTTTNGGYYLFDNLFPRDYVVVIPSRNFSGTGLGEGILKGYMSSLTQMSVAGLLPDAAPDVDTTPADSDDNGVQTSLLYTREVRSLPITLGPGGDTEPIGELAAQLESGILGDQGAQPDGRANMTVDFGFYKTEIGNIVFADVNRDGTYNALDTFIDGAQVQIYVTDGTTQTEIRVGPDGFLGTTDDALGGVTTISGEYKFIGLPVGDYVISATVPVGASSTKDNFSASDSTDPDQNVDNNDNGQGTNEGIAYSGVLTVTPGNTGMQNKNTVANLDGRTTNPTVDFGFITAYALGNRIWFDTDNNGARNGTETGVDGVNVELYYADVSGLPTTPVYEPDGTTPKTDITVNGGYYLFDYLNAGDYVVVVSAANFSGSGKLVGYWSSQTTILSTGSIDESVAPDPDGAPDIDSDDNGRRDTAIASVFYKAVTSKAITLGGAAEPINEADVNPSGAGALHQGYQPDDRSNMTVDFGFYKAEIGDLVYYDKNVNGLYDSLIDAPLDGVTVKLYSANGAQILTGADGILGTLDDGSTDGVITGGGFGAGKYLFSGLPASNPNAPIGNFIIKVTTPDKMLSTVDSVGTTDPEGNIDGDDNGPGTGNGIITSNPITLTGAEVRANITVSDAVGSTYDHSVDFGFVDAYTIGNRIWFDADNSATLNGIESGIDGVTVQLWTDPNNDNDPIDGLKVGNDVTTANGGYYLFDYLIPGNYIVVIPSGNFSGAGKLVGYWSSLSKMDSTGLASETAAPDPDLGIDGAVGGGDDDRDSDDSGMRQPNGDVISKAITLGLFGPTEPINESDVDLIDTGVDHQGAQLDNRANMTLDFGFYKTEIGGLIFSDGSKNGNYESLNDVELAGVTVQLFAANGTREIRTGSDGVLGTADDGAGGMLTDVNGSYLFSGLPAGDYIVKVTSPAGMTSTIDSFNQPDSEAPDVNADNNDNGMGVIGGIVSSSSIDPLTMTPGGGTKPDTTSKMNVVVDTAKAITTDLTMDFGFIPAFSLGNRVWYDTDNDGRIDTGESGADGVTVKIYAADGTTQIPVGVDGILGTADDGVAGVLTSGGGYYLFNNLPTGDYVVIIPASNFTGILKDYLSSGVSRTDAGLNDETVSLDPDASPVNDVDDNGMRRSLQSATGDVVSKPITLGPNPIEPTTETDLGAGGQGQPNNQANMTVDFGFYTTTLGNIVWFDTDNSGVLDGTPLETGKADVTVELWSMDESTLLASTTTDADGLYSFAGVPAGNYVLRIPAVEFNPGGTLRDYVSSTGPGLGAPFVYEPAPSAEGNTTNSDDNGTAVPPLNALAGPDGTFNSSLGLGGYIQTSMFALTPDGEDVISSASPVGRTNEPRIDFGLYANALTDLSVTKVEVPNQDYYIAGSTLNYMITVTNNGPSDVTGAKVVDALPPQIESWTWTCAAGNPAASNCTGTGTNVPANSAGFQDFIDLKQKESLTYNVVATVVASATGVLTNSVIVTTPAGVAEIDSLNNTASDVDQPASLQVTKDDGLTIVGANSTITYQIVVTNNGLVDLTTIKITDDLPGDLTFVSANPAPDTRAGNLLTWSGRSLTIASSMTISVTATVSAAPAGTIANEVNVLDTTTGASATGRDIDSTASLPNNNLAKQLFGTDAIHTTSPNIAIGEILTYQVVMSVPVGSMTNAILVDVPQSGLAFVDLTSLTVSDPDTDASSPTDSGLYSSRMTFDPGTGACTNCAAGTNSLTANPLIENSGGKVTFKFETLTNSSGSVQTITILYRVIVLDISANKYTLSTSLLNNAAWTWTGGSLAAAASPVKVVEPDMSIDKKADTVLAPYGTAITFTFDIAHTVNSSADAFDVVVTDKIPAGLVFVPKSVTSVGLEPTTTSYDPLTKILTIVWDEFPLNEKSSVSFKTVFAGPSPVLNESSVAWTSLPIDPGLAGPVLLSVYNPNSTERWYDPADAAGLNSYGAKDSITITAPLLPGTGFAPGMLTELSAQPADQLYSKQGDIWLEIPELDLKMAIVGIPLNGDNGWNLTWLADQAGWLEGTAYPSHPGNSVITAHLNGADGEPGPFIDLNRLYWGHKVILHINGLRYIYEVRESRTLWPEDKSAFKHEEYSWLTLVTCKDYVESSNTYSRRLIVRAVLVRIE